VHLTPVAAIPVHWLTLISDMSYTVYRVSYAGLPRDHHAIFVEMNNDQSGHVFQVTGDIQNGMKHNDKPAKKPEESGTYQSKEVIGRVKSARLKELKTEQLDRIERFFALLYIRATATAESGVTNGAKDQGKG
jgi:hypothetical protein